MSTVLESPEIELSETDRHAFNLAVWKRLVNDPALAALPYRVETDRFGQMLMSPPPAPSHGNRQVEIGRILANALPEGKVVSECPISTREGVKAIDVAWCSREKWERLGDQVCFREAPEICVEIISPTNTKGEMAEKKTLYFEEGAEEVWFCELDGRMTFHLGADQPASEESGRLPDFPKLIS